jgi:hypothetical protein
MKINPDRTEKEFLVEQYEECFQHYKESLEKIVQGEEDNLYAAQFLLCSAMNKLRGLLSRKSMEIKYDHLINYVRNNSQLLMRDCRETVYCSDLVALPAEFQKEVDSVVKKTFMI